MLDTEKSAALGDVYDLFFTGDVVGAIRRWDEYHSRVSVVASSVGGVRAIPMSFDEKVFMCAVFITHSYADLQNTDCFRRALAAVFSMRELTGQSRGRWWADFLSSKTDETFRCDELVRTARECENGRPDARAPDGYRLDAAEVYFLTVWRKWNLAASYKKMTTAGATSVLLSCRKDTCSCPHKGMGEMSVDGFVLPPYKYGCNAYLNFSGF